MGGSLGMGDGDCLVIWRQLWEPDKCALRSSVLLCVLISFRPTVYCRMRQLRIFRSAVYCMVTDEAMAASLPPYSHPLSCHLHAAFTIAFTRVILHAFLFYSSSKRHPVTGRSRGLIRPRWSETAFAAPSPPSSTRGRPSPSCGRYTTRRNCSRQEDT